MSTPLSLLLGMFLAVVSIEVIGPWSLLPLMGILFGAELLLDLRGYRHE